MKLSILICTTLYNITNFDSLLANLTSQECEEPIQIIYDDRELPDSIKQKALGDTATGDFVVFIKDEDTGDCDTFIQDSLKHICSENTIPELNYNCILNRVIYHKR